MYLFKELYKLVLGNPASQLARLCHSQEYPFNLFRSFRAYECDTGHWGNTTAQWEWSEDYKNQNIRLSRAAVSRTVDIKSRLICSSWACFAAASSDPPAGTPACVGEACGVWFSPSIWMAVTDSSSKGFGPVVGLAILYGSKGYNYNYHNRLWRTIQ